MKIKTHTLFILFTLTSSVSCTKINFDTVFPPSNITNNDETIFQAPYISTGAQHTCVVDTDSSLKCWGDNTNGEVLPPSNLVPRSIPNHTAATSMPSIELEPYRDFAGTTADQFQIVSASSSSSTSSCGIFFGALKCWGSRYLGMIGDGVNDYSYSPQYTLFKSGVTKITSWGGGYCAVVSEQVFCWGGGVTTPKLAYPSDVLDFASGGGTNCIITTQNKLLCWGSNQKGQLALDASITSQETPHEIFSSGVSHVAVGDKSICAVHDEALKCWGDNYNAQVGTPPINVTPTNFEYFMGIYYTPQTIIPAPAGIVKIKSGGSNTCILLADSSLKCWGINYNNQMGTYQSLIDQGYGTQYKNSSLIIPTTIFTSGVTDFSLSYDFSCYVVNGSVICAGRQSNNIMLNNVTDSYSNTTDFVTVIPSGIKKVSVSMQESSAPIVFAQSETKILGWGHGGSGAINGKTISGVITTPVDATTDLTAPAPSFPYKGAQSFKPLAVGSEHSCSISPAGALSCWGKNNYGQVGKPSPTVMSTPTQIIAGNVSAVAAGLDHTCAIVGGSIKCWGRNNYGQAGKAFSMATVTSPMEIIASGASDIAAGDNHTCAVITEDLYCWGDNASGQLGNDKNVPRSETPIKVITGNVLGLSAKGNKTCANVAGKLTCFGANYIGEIDSDINKETIDSPLETHISADKIAAGSWNICSILSGDLKCWGANDLGQVGTGDLLKESYDILNAPTIDTSVTQVSVGENQICYIKSGALYCMGDARVIGRLEKTFFETPSLVISKGVTHVETGTAHTCAIVSGEVQCWGYRKTTAPQGTLDKLGREVSAFINAPVTVIPKGVKKVEVGNDHTCAIMSDELYCWGLNTSFQVGPTDLPSYLPFKVPLPGKVTEVSLGSTHTCAISDEDLWCWGKQTGGVIGNGVANNSFAEPVKVLTGKVSHVSVSSASSCAVQDSNLLCWGSATNGKLGNGVSAANFPIPLTIIAGGVSSVSTSPTHTCAIKDSNLLCWGRAVQGRLGNGDESTTIYSTPPATPTLTGGVTSVTAGTQGTCVTQSDKLFCFGSNSHGQLASEDIELASTPMEMPMSMSQYSYKGTHACGINDNKVYCIGDGSTGKLALLFDPADDYPYSSTFVEVLKLKPAEK